MAFYGILVGAVSVIVVLTLAAQLSAVQQQAAYATGYSEYTSIQKVEMFEMVIGHYNAGLNGTGAQNLLSALSVSASEDGVGMNYTNSSIVLASGSNPTVYAFINR